MRLVAPSFHIMETSRCEKMKPPVVVDVPWVSLEALIETLPLWKVLEIAAQ